MEVTNNFELDYEKRRITLSILANRFLIVILIFAEYKYFCLPSDLNNFFVYYNVGSNELIKILISLIIIIFNLNILKRVYKNSEHFKSIFILFALLALSAVLSLLTFGGSKIIFNKFVNVCFLPLSYIVLSIFVQKEGTLSFLFKTLTIINTVACVLFVAQAVVYNAGGSLFLTIDWANNQIYMRNGLIRIIECGSMVMLSFSLSLCELLNTKHKNKLLHLLNAVMSFTYLWFGQTRSAILVCIVILAIVLMIGFKANTPFKLLIKFVVICTLAASFAFGMYQEIIESLTITRTEKSYTARAGAYFYYWGLLKSYIFYGLGFVDYKGSPEYSLIHGYYGLYYPSDVGIIGTAINFGLATGIWYLAKLFMLIKNYVASHKKCIMELAVVVMAVATSFTMSLMDNERFMMFAMILIFAQYSKDYKNEIVRGTLSKLRYNNG